MVYWIFFYISLFFSLNVCILLLLMKIYDVCYYVIKMYDIDFNKLVIVGILWEEIRGWGEVEWVEWSGF